jgi:lysozyme
MGALKLNFSTLVLVSGLKTAAAKEWHKTSDSGEVLVQGFEGLRLKAYKCPAGVWTIGWGSTFYANGKPVKQGDKLLNKECADDLLEHTLKIFADAVNNLVKVSLNQNQFDALVSLVFNIGTNGFKSSTLLRKLNAGDYAGAAAQFAVWRNVTVNGVKQVSPVLVARRAKEAKLFLKPIL